VAARTQLVAAEHRTEDFTISHARLVQIENEGSTPSLQKLFALSIVYGVPLVRLLDLYLNLDSAARLHSSMQLPNTHLSSIEHATGQAHAPTTANRALAVENKETRVLNSSTEIHPEALSPLIRHLRNGKFRYGLIGSSDYTMYPMIRPGSMVQIDDSRKTPKPARYQSEYDRPIYFIELRGKFICSWCELHGNRLVSTPHPASPCRTQVFAYPNEAEIVGQVIGVALSLSAPEPVSMFSKASGSLPRSNVAF
jgi:transcriptional regulator with XRE-family HTH domain